MFHHQSSPTDIQMSVSVYIYCMFACVHVCVCGELTFPVSRITVCLMFLLSSFQQRKLTSQGRSLHYFILSLEGATHICACVCVYKERTENCVVSTLG